MAPGPVKQPFKGRAAVLAAAVAAVIFVGTLTGAQLKSDSQKAQAIEQFHESPVTDQISALEAQKRVLMQQRAALQKKLDLFHERVEERKEELSKRAK